MRCVFSVAVIAASASTPALAGIVQGPVVAPFDAQAEITFVSRSAGWTGELSFLGTSQNAISAPQYLMSNSAAAGDAASLGLFNSGDELLFQYEIVSGGPNNTYRMDDPAGALQFQHEFTSSNVARLYVEDIELPGGDRDYNDAVFDVTFTQVPGPGPLALAGMGGMLALRRRRR